MSIRHVYDRFIDELPPVGDHTVSKVFIGDDNGPIAWFDAGETFAAGDWLTIEFGPQRYQRWCGDLRLLLK